MQNRETRVNQSLKHLVDEFRTGMASVDDYRIRRSVILNSWNDHDITTSPRRSTSVTTPAAAPVQAATRAVKPAATARKLHWFALIGFLLVTFVAAWYVERTRESPQQSVHPDLKLATDVADRFLQRNRWEEDDVEGFLLIWERLTPTLQQQARTQPSIRALRYELAQNLALMANDSGGTDSETRDRLRSFAERLDATLPP